MSFGRFPVRGNVDVEDNMSQRWGVSGTDRFFVKAFLRLPWCEAVTKHVHAVVCKFCRFDVLSACSTEDPCQAPPKPTAEASSEQ